MSLRKVTFFDNDGPAIKKVDEDGQAKPCVLGVRWVNPDTIETIGVCGGNRTGPTGDVVKIVRPVFHRPGTIERDELDSRRTQSS